MLAVSDLLKSTKKASRVFYGLSADKISSVLVDLSVELIESAELILAENKRDLDFMNPNLSIYDRVKLSYDRIKDISVSLVKVSQLPDPTNKNLLKKQLPSGLKIQQVTVPLGVVGIIYEARPNVTVDVFALCLKSRNACVLKGGSDATYTNQVLVSLIKKVLAKHNIDTNVINLLPSSRESVMDLFYAQGLVDVIIPRGSQNLIEFVRQNSQIPVIETGAGVCHIYWEATGRTDFAKNIVINAKTRRPSVCNSLDCLIIDRQNIGRFVQVAEVLFDHGVEILADKDVIPLIKDFAPDNLLFESTTYDYGTEFLSLKMVVKVVDSFTEALEHIDQFSSGHSEAIITEDKEKAIQFLTIVDSACVYHNTSIAFTDGGQFDLGAEVGISTQKLHARGPMGLDSLTSYKWVITSEGAIRN